ncbi:MAG: acetyl-CoA hydrolase/transferase family protein [Solirubrobacterales bacterium]
MFAEAYRQKLMSSEAAAGLIRSGDGVIVPLANGQPPALINALAKRILADEVQDVNYISALDVRFLDIHNQEACGKAEMETLYAGPISRYFVQQGQFAYTPHRLWEGPDIAGNCRDASVYMMTVSPMDKNGFFSTGTNPDYIWGMTRESMKHRECRILLEVNRHMPRTCGNNQFHISEVTAVVEADTPLVCLPDIPVTAEDEAIGRYIAEQVPDGACLQLGIGGIPNAVARFLEDKRDLGIHSEMLCDSMLDLFRKGVITCRQKSFNPYKWIGSFVLGSQELYDFVADNLLIEMHSSKYVNDPYCIGLNDNMIAINSTLEVDLTGQCASEAIGTQQYSGTGGQVDFVEGAWRSNGGKAFLALYATYTDKEGRLHSKIKPTLSPGSMVTTTRNDVQYVVTEFGIAYLKGQNMRRRIEELIRIAHPDFRDELRFEAKKLRYLP